jgi:hypothetical protein
MGHNRGLIVFLGYSIILLALFGIRIDPHPMTGARLH